MGSGGGGGSDMPFYDEQNRLFGTQANIAQGMYNQYAHYAPNTLFDLAKMVDDANSGAYEQRMYDMMRNQAFANNASANAMERQATERQLSSMGVNPNDPRFASQLRGMELGNTARLASGLNQSAYDARMQGENMSWARTHDFYNTLAGMPTTATSNLASAGAGYGQMSAQANQNATANASGFGKYGQQTAEALFKADGGLIKRRGLHGRCGHKMAAGGLIPVAGKNPYTLDSINIGLGSGKKNKGNSTLNAIASYAAPIAGYALSKYLKGKVDGLFSDGTQAPAPVVDPAPPITGGAFVGVPESASPHFVGPPDSAAPGYYGPPESAMMPTEFAAQGAEELVPAMTENVDWASILGGVIGAADGGLIRPRSRGGLRRGQRLALGGMVGGGFTPRGMSGGMGLQRQNPMQMSSASAGRAPMGGGGAAEAPDPVMGMAKNYASKQLGNYIAQEGGKYLSAQAPAQAAAVESASTVLPGAATNLLAPAAETALSGMAGGELATGLVAGETAGGAATGAGGAAAGAEAGSAAGPWGALIGAAVGLLANELFKADGGEVKAVKGLAGPRQRRKDVSHGGEIDGPGTETSDDVPVMASDGEYMLNAESVKLVGVDFLDRLNKLGLEMRKKDEEKKRRGRGMARGGMVKKNQRNKHRRC